MDQSAISSIEAPGRIRAQFYFDEDHNCDMCKVWIIGDTGNLLLRVSPEIIAKYPREWESYQKTGGSGGGTENIGGTPLREVPGVNQNMAAVLRYNVIRNAEELAGLDETVARDMGKAFLDAHRAAKLVVKDKQETDAANRIAELEAKIAQLEEKPKRGPGRPRKEPESEELDIPDNAA